MSVALDSFLGRCKAVLPFAMHEQFMNTLVSFKHGELSEADADTRLLTLLSHYEELLVEYNAIMSKARPFSSHIGARGMSQYDANNQGAVEPRHSVAHETIGAAPLNVFEDALEESLQDALEPDDAFPVAVPVTIDDDLNLRQQQDEMFVREVMGI